MCGVGGDITLGPSKLCDIDREGPAVYTCSIDEGRFMQLAHQGEIFATIIAFQPFIEYKYGIRGILYTSTLLSSWPKLKVEFSFSVPRHFHNTEVKCRGVDRNKDYERNLRIGYLSSYGKRSAL